MRVEEREVISRELAGGLSCRAIAVVLGRHQSVVSREVDRHGAGGRIGRLRPRNARTGTGVGRTNVFWLKINGCTRRSGTGWRTSGPRGR